MTLKWNWHSWRYDILYDMEDSLIFCTVSRFIAKSRLKRVKVHVSGTTSYTSDSVSTGKAVMFLIPELPWKLYWQNSTKWVMSPYAFCAIEGKKYFNCPELRRAGRTCASTALRLHIIYLFRFHFTFSSVKPRVWKTICHRLICLFHPVCLTF